MIVKCDYAPAIARYLAFPDAPTTQLSDLVSKVLAMSDYPDRATLEQMQQQINTTLYADRKIALIYGGATKIKGYVFEAPKLPEIRGASALLDWINEVAIPQLWDATSPEDYVERGIIYASGGNILAFAPAEQGADRAKAIEHAYTEHTLTANSVAVSALFSLLELRFGRNPLSYWVEQFVEDCKDPSVRAALENYYYLPNAVKEGKIDPLRWQFYNRKTFGELVTLLATMSNRRRDERASHGEVRSLPYYELIPWAEKCQSSDVRPALISVEVGGDQRLISDASARKRAVGQAVKRGEIGQLKKTLEPWAVPDTITTQSWENRWEQYIAKHPDSHYAQHMGPQNVRAASDVDTIGASSKRYIGLIYADGNNIGRLIATIQKPENYHMVSQVLSSVAQTAVFEALAKHLKPTTLHQRHSEEYLHPFEILAIGGDDLFIIVPGNQALEIALTIGNLFEAMLTQKFDELKLELPCSQRVFSRYAPRSETVDPITMPLPSVGLSTGVIIAQDSMPIFFLRDLVDELLKNAKKLAKHHAQDKTTPFFGGAIDFMALKSTTMVTDTIKGFRKAALGDGSPRRLTARPYSWHEFAGLLDTVRALKKANVPRSQLYRIRSVLGNDNGGGILTSVMEYLYTRSRLPNNVEKTLVEHIEYNWCHSPRFPDRRLGVPPWMPLGEHNYETIWTDLLEIYDFVCEKEA